METRGGYARAALAGTAVLLTYLVASNGLVFFDYAPAVQVALIAGLIGGALALDPRTAAGVTAAGLLGGIALQPAGVYPAPAEVLVTLVVGAGVAALVRLALKSGAVQPGLAVALALVLVVGNFWLTAVTVAPVRRQNGAQMSLFEVLAHRPQRGEDWGDSGFFRNVVWKMRDGGSFYEAYRDGINERWSKAPYSVFMIRQPTIFTLWRDLPGWPRSVFYAFLVFATAGIVAAPFVSRRAVPLAAGVAGAAAVAAYLLRFALEHGLLFLQEEWIGPLVVVVLALYAAAQDERRHRAWMLAAVAVTLAGMFLRELMLFVALAGLAGAFFSRREHRRFDLAAWGGAIVVWSAWWGVHASRAHAVFSATKADTSAWVGQGAGVANLLHGLTDFTQLLSAHMWVPVALAVLGVAGALAQRDRQFRAFATAAVCMPLVGFLFVSNGAADLAHGVSTNYWGAIVMPALLALAPSALLLLPGLRRPATAQATEDEGDGAEMERQAAGA